MGISKYHSFFLYTNDKTADREVWWDMRLISKTTRKKDEERTTDKEEKIINKERKNT